ncbi:MAG TPA: hypothetical protein VJP86_09055 [Vicinamibacterales bacterium]|jgi:hypothetical protein|nr:hypothetical protein [Vicinamibacterales bacterium]
MQQRQLRLGDILDDYCPRERRLTNHSVVAMIGDEVKRTRCNTCDAEHEYKHAKVPRQRKKGEEPAALYSQVLASGPKRVSHEAPARALEEPQDHDLQSVPEGDEPTDSPRDEDTALSLTGTLETTDDARDESLESLDIDAGEEEDGETAEEGPVHRPLIRATLPRHEGQVPPARQTPDFTIRQPGGRPNRFRARNQRGGGHMFQGNRSGGPGGSGPRGPRQHGNRPQGGPPRRHDAGRKRSK